MTAISNFRTKKWNTVIYIILIIIVITAMFALKRCMPIDHLNVDDKKNDNTINIAIEYSPLSLYTYDDTLGGFCYDFMRIIEPISGHKFKFNPIVSLENTLAGLDKGIYDMVIAQFPATKENRDKFLFSDAVYIDRQVLIQLKDSVGNISIKTQLDLAGNTVYVIKGSPMRSRLANLSHEIGDTIYIAEDVNYGTEQLFLRVATGEIQYAVINKSIAAKMAKSYPNVSYSTEISFSQFQPIILRKNDTILCDSLNQWIQTTKQSALFKSLQSRYF